MNDHSTFSGCLISLLSNAGFSTFDILDQKCVGSSITLGILGTLAHFRHFSGLSGLGAGYTEFGMSFHWVTSCTEVVWMVGIFTCDLMGKSAYVKKKWASRNLISVDDFSIGKGQDSLIFRTINVLVAP